MKYQSAYRFKWIGVFIAALLILAQARRADAQAQKGAISGIVTDQGGAVLKGAQVSVEGQDISVVTDEEGNFHISDINPGSYTLTVSYVGFKDAQQTVSVSSGQTAKADAKLDVKSQNESILVTAPRVTGEVDLGLVAVGLVAGEQLLRADLVWAHIEIVELF